MARGGVVVVVQHGHTPGRTRRLVCGTKLMSAGLYLLRPRVTSHTTCLPAIFSQVRLIVCWQEIASTAMKQSGKRLSLQPDYCYRSLCTSGDGRALNPIVVRVWLSNGGKEAAYKHSADFCQRIPVKYTGWSVKQQQNSLPERRKETVYVYLNVK